jgi:hypothetical protein
MKKKSSFQVIIKVSTHQKMDVNEVERLIVDVLKQYFYKGRVEAK